MSDRFGEILSITTFGESHGESTGVVVDGCPAGLKVSESEIQAQLNRRRPGQSDLTTARDEKDQIHIVSGIEKGVTLGTPISMHVDNTNTRPGDYKELENTPRPSHADYTYRAKYGTASVSGGGRASARETIGRVAAGVIAEKLLMEKCDLEIVAWVSAVGTVEAPDMTEKPISRKDVDSNDVRCPDTDSAERMTGVIKSAVKDEDSVGGIVTCVCRNVPAGWGEPVFDKMEARLAAAMLSIPAVKGFEIGSGFAGTRVLGSENNDMFVMKETGLGTETNNSGGVQGGITNGEPVVFRVAFKPPASISRTQNTVDYDGQPVSLQIKGRHDPCVLPRAVPIVEAMAALVLADMALIAG